jgi:hypothetical protein
LGQSFLVGGSSLVKDHGVMSGVKSWGFFILWFSIVNFCEFAVMLCFLLFNAFLIVELKLINFGLHVIDLCFFLFKHEDKLVTKDLLKINSAIVFF